MSEIYIKQSTAVAARPLGDDMMIMSAADSTLFSLNPVAACIWQAADGCTSLSQIVTREVCSIFDVDAGTAYRDAVELVEALARHGILTISDHPADRPIPVGAPLCP
jgi:Coenzyme PQQ synthesis protein D (PqqD)